MSEDAAFTSGSLRKADSFMSRSYISVQEAHYVQVSRALLHSAAMKDICALDRLLLNFYFSFYYAAIMIKRKKKQH